MVGNDHGVCKAQIFFFSGFDADSRKELTCLDVWTSVTLYLTTLPFLAFMQVPILPKFKRTGLSFLLCVEKGLNVELKCLTFSIIRHFLL